jgi:hypothetical protein
MANQVDTLIDKEVTELIRTCATTEHDKLEALEDCRPSVVSARSFNARGTPYSASTSGACLRSLIVLADVNGIDPVGKRYNGFAA